LLRKISLLDVSLSPKGLHDFLLVQDFIAVADKKQQELQRFWTQRNSLSFAQQNAVVRVQEKASELIRNFDFCRHGLQTGRAEMRAFYPFFVRGESANPY
jgi:hypothetical protein